VSDQDFFFALDLSGGPGFDRMLGDLARAVLAHVGYAASASDALAGQLRAALDRVADGQRRCELRFQAQDGELLIVVAGAGRPEWRTTWPLPVS
jgi:hypothetical protein